MQLAQSFVVHSRADRRPLYLEGGDGSGAGGAVVLPDGSVAVPAGTVQGFCTYFNAFPASYWVRWTGTTTVRLEVQLEGTGVVRVLRSAADGSPTVVATRSVQPSVTVDVDVRDAATGGWLWFDVEAHAEVVVRSAHWYVDAPPRRSGEICLAMPTMNKPDFCVATLEALAASHELRALIGTVYVVDQGTDKVANHPRYADVAADLGPQLTLIDQPNLGGSGGFSRAMLETLGRPGATAVMLLDDDVQIEPEAVARAIRFHLAAADDVIVGGQMLDLHHPTVLHAFSEVVDQRHFMWGSAVRDQERHDLGERPLRETPWLHGRAEADYNGWWMCLVPVAVLRRIGLSLPLFLKWDDAEFGLRAHEVGVPTVSLPGAALWHESWLDKDDTVEWQAYLHVRNRVVTALLHARRPWGGALLRDLLATDLKLLISLRYYPVALHVAAIEEVLRGPGRLHAELDGLVPRLRARGTEFGETQKYATDDPRLADAPDPDDLAVGARPVGARLAAYALAQVLRHGFRAVPAAARDRPQTTLSRQQATWWTVPRLDSVVVLSADKSSATWLRRDRALFWRLGLATVAAHLRLALHWWRASHRWRHAAGGLSAPDTWRRTFGR